MRGRWERARRTPSRTIRAYAIRGRFAPSPSLPRACIRWTNSLACRHLLSSVCCEFHANRRSSILLPARSAVAPTKSFRTAKFSSLEGHVVLPWMHSLPLSARCCFETWEPIPSVSMWCFIGPSHTFFEKVVQGLLGSLFRPLRGTDEPMKAHVTFFLCCC